MWGQVQICLYPIHFPGIIPMRVGTSIYADTDSIHCEDHPHACGDKALCCCAWDAYAGSSPCVWGQEQAIKRLLDSVRIIPMRVGTRSSIDHLHRRVKDHPHACGDKLFALKSSILPMGSSPCVWGQVLTSVKTCTIIRIIPMRVGTSKGVCDK